MGAKIPELLLLPKVLGGCQYVSLLRNTDFILNLIANLLFIQPLQVVVEDDWWPANFSCSCGVSH